MRILKVILLSIALSSCSGIPLTEKGKIIRQIDTSWSNQCVLIGTEEITNASFGAHPGICKKRAFDDMKNRIGELGGNAYVITYVNVAPCLTGGTTITFEAFKCPDEKSISITIDNQPKANENDSLYTKLKDLKKLLDEGIINQEEYDIQKKKILHKN